MSSETPSWQLAERAEVRQRMEARFESQLLPLFKRRTREVSALLPYLYLHGLAQGDFELALRGLLGDGAPLSHSSLQRLRVKWEAAGAERERHEADERKS